MRLYEVLMLTMAMELEGKGLVEVDLTAWPNLMVLILYCESSVSQ